MADYESMTREELINAIHRFGSKADRRHPHGDPTTIECKYALLQTAPFGCIRAGCANAERAIGRSQRIRCRTHVVKRK